MQGDIKEVPTLFEKASFDVVTTNPPYMNDSHGLKNPDLPKAIARHEVLCNLEDVVRAAASKHFVPGGRLYMVHRPRRLIEIHDGDEKSEIGAEADEICPSVCR